MNIAFVEDNYTLWEREGAFTMAGVTPEFMLTRWQSTMDIYAGVLTKLGDHCFKYVPSLTRGPPESYRHELGHEVVKVPCLDGVTNLLTKVDWRLSALSFTRSIDAHRLMQDCDLVHYHSLYSSYFLASPRLRHARRRTAHYTGGRFPTGLSFPRRSFARKFLRQALAACDGVLLDEEDPESRQQGEFLTREMGLAPWKIRPFATIPVDTSVFNERDKGRSRSRLKLGGEGPVILAVTAVGEEPPPGDVLAKNIFRLVRIFGMLVRQTRSAVELHIVGSGPGMDALKALVSSLGLQARVHLHGLVPHDLIPDYISASDLVFVPYHFEDLTFGTAVFEAFACRRPVAGFTRSESSPVECAGGVLVSLDDQVAAGELAARISDPDYLSRKAEEGGAVAIGHGADRLGRKLESIFAGILREGGRPRRGESGDGGYPS